jgi:pilus assembly protein Flp/PilA
LKARLKAFQIRNTKHYKPNTKTKGERKMKKLMNFFKDEEGATMVEYGLMVALIAVVCIAAVTLVGTNVAAVFTSISTSLQNAL